MALGILAVGGATFIKKGAKTPQPTPAKPGNPSALKAAPKPKSPPKIQG
jgi:hypothetical protein